MAHGPDCICTACCQSETFSRALLGAGRTQINATARADVWLALSAHYLAGIECDHAKKQDRASCACSAVALPWQPSVGAAVESWIAHVKEVVASANSGHRSPPIGAATPGTMSDPGMVPARALWERIHGHSHSFGIRRCDDCERWIAGALASVRAEERSAIEALIEEEEEGPHGQEWQLGDVASFRRRLLARVHARAPAPPTSPASADATEEPAK